MPGEPTGSASDVLPHRPALARSPDPGERIAGTAVQTWAPRLAQLTTIAVLTGYGFVIALNVFRIGTGWSELIRFTVLFAVVFSLQIAHSWGEPLRWPARLRILTLSAQALATYLPFIWIGEVWGGMAAFLAGSVLLVATNPLRWILFGVVGASVLAPAMAAHLSAADVGYYVVSTVLTGLVIFAVSSLSGLVLEVNRTRAEMARMAVIQERLRVARDLHDLLGYSLSTITLKSELTHRLLPHSADRARQHLAEVLDVARQALADVRQVATGYRDMSLADEAESARSVLAAAEVDADIEISCGALPRAVDTVMATVLREAITNVLRHSKAGTCVIRATEHAGTVRLEVGNDAATVNLTASLEHGSGLDNLASRLERIGGRLSAGLRDKGWFQLLAEAPLGQSAES